MKKIIRKIAVLMFASMLLITPTTSALAAASQPVCVSDYGYGKFFEFQPGPYELLPGQQIALANNVIDGYWAVPNGHNYHLYATSNFEGGNGILTYTVYRILPTYSVVAHGTSWNGALFIDVPPFIGPSDQAALYFIVLTNNTSQTVNVTDYGVFYQ